MGLRRALEFQYLKSTGSANNKGFMTLTLALLIILVLLAFALHVRISEFGHHLKLVLRNVVHLKESIMPSISELKAAVLAKAQEVQDAISAVVVTETAQVVAKLQALKDQIAQGANVSPGDFDDIINSVGGIAPAVNAKVDAISEADTAPGPGNGGNPTP